MASQITKCNPLGLFDVCFQPRFPEGYNVLTDPDTADGAVYTVRVLSRDDLDRQIVKSNSCSVIIPEFELTIPPGRGQLTTIEGLIRDIITDLSADQPLRRVQNPPAYEKIENILERCREIVPDDDDEEGDDPHAVGPVKTAKKASEIDVPLKPFTLKLDDPAGNSFAEFVGSMADPKWNMRTYHRTRQHNIELGLVAPDDPEPDAPKEVELSKDGNLPTDAEQIGGGAEGENEEIYRFPGTCSSCGHPSDTLIKKVNIPYFKVRFRSFALLPEWGLDEIYVLGHFDHVNKL